MVNLGVSALQAGVYVPRVVREWVVSEDADRLHRRVEGTMVFADVSGFTKMSERLAKLGRVGAESVTEIIEACFSSLLSEAYRYGGTLLQFSGDALLLFFRDEDHARRGAAAALTMRRVLRERGTITTEAGAVNLSMTVGVESGEFDMFLVGGSHRQLLIGGPASSHLVELEGAAVRGRILIGEATAAALPSRNVGPMSGPGRLLRGTLDIGTGHEVRFFDSDHDMSALTPVGLVRAIEAGSVESEHRAATVGFVQYQGIDEVIAEHGPAVAAERLDTLVRSVQAAIDHRDICFQSADLDRNGGKFYLSVGAPFATGHDEELMLLAARQIADIDVGLRIRVGVNRGPVFTGEIGTIHRRTYATMGDTVNLAARVMGRAEWGTVLATMAVLDHSRTVFDTTEVPPFQVKGKRSHVVARVISEPIGTRADVASADIPLVGRDAERTAFAAELDRVRRSEGRYVELVAAAGAGKSRLIEQLEIDAGSAERGDEHDVRADEQMPVPFLRVACRLYQSTTPYYPFGELLRLVLGIREGAAPRAAADALRRAVGERAPHLEPWLALLGVPLGLQIDDSPEVAALDAEFRRPQLERSVGELLDRLIGEPTVICIEDAQWIDDASSDLLTALIRDLGRRPWCLLVATQPGAQPAGEDVAPDLQIALPPLGDDDLRELVSATTTGVPLAQHVVDVLIERSGGNPMFLLELVAAVRGGGSLASLPDSVDGLITARIDRLSIGERKLLRNLATLGTSFKSAFVGDVLPEDMTESPKVALPRLGEFIRFDGDMIHFRHGLVRDVAYEGLPYKVRWRLHGQIAESMLERLGARADDEAALLSWHFSRARREAESWHYSRIAGDRARQSHANVEAVRLYRRALRSARALDDVGPRHRGDVLEALGDVQDLAGLYEQARRSYTAARTLRSDPVDAATIHLKIAYVDERVGAYVRAVRHIRSGQRLLADRDDPEAVRHRGRLAAWLSAVRLAQGRFQESYDASIEAIACAERVEDDATLAQAYLTVDFAGSVLGKGAVGDPTRQAHEIYAALGDLPGQASAHNSLGAFAYMDGRWEEAAEHYGRSRAARQQAGDPVSAALADANLAEIRVEQGRLDEGLELLAAAVETAHAAGDRAIEALARRLQAAALGRAGDVSAAHEQLQRAAHLFAELGAAGGVLETDIVRAELHLLGGRPETAREILDAVLADRADRLGSEHLLPGALRLRALANLECGDEASVRSDFEAALDHALVHDADLDLVLIIDAIASVERRIDLQVDDELRRRRDAIVDRLGISARLSRPLSGAARG